MGFFAWWKRKREPSRTPSQTDQLTDEDSRAWEDSGTLVDALVASTIVGEEVTHFIVKCSSCDALLVVSKKGLKQDGPRRQYLSRPVGCKCGEQIALIGR